jgi:protein-tyrosine-phosphatase
MPILPTELGLHRLSRSDRQWGWGESGVQVGIDISQEFPKPWTDVFLGADVVVTMGCGDACPLVPGRRYEDWGLEDPTNRSSRSGPFATL